MTSSGQDVHGTLHGEADDTRWSTRQILSVAVGALISAALWALTPITHSASGGWLSNLAWTAAATVTLAVLNFARRIADGHRDERRMQRVENLVHLMYDRQEDLAGQIQRQQTDGAESMLARQREIADSLTRAWNAQQRSLDGLRKRLGKLVALQEQREATARVRSSDFEANARTLIERMEALAMLVESRMPLRQLGFKHRGDGA